MNRLRTVFAVLLLALAAPVLATPKDDLHASFVKFLEIKTFRATISDAAANKVLSTLDFVAPDRYRMKNPQGPQMIIIGQTVWMEMGGQMRKLPMPVGDIVKDYRNEEKLRELQKDMQVEQLPDDAVDGEPARVYRYTVTEPRETEATTWISKKSGLPLQVETTGKAMGKDHTTRIRYSHFDDPAIQVEAPN